MRKFGLIGYPLGHSFSKRYFADKFLNEKITDCYYDNFPLSDINKLPELITDNPDLIGLNVTIPYKSQVLKFIDIIDDEAKAIGAVNVLKIKRNKGKVMLYGFNSDITGIRDSLLPYINDNFKKAIVLGTGGSSKAVIYVLEKMGLGVTVVSRSEKAGSIRYSDVSDEVIKGADLIINSTPIGMFPDIELMPQINYNALEKRHVLFDLVYNPENTAFLRMGKKHGCSVIGGIKMLHSQAERAWTIWNDDDY